MQGLELPNPPLLASTDLPPACDQPPSPPPTPPGPAHNFPEPEDTTGQARQRTATGSGTRMGPRVLCRVVFWQHDGKELWLILFLTMNC